MALLNSASGCLHEIPLSLFFCQVSDAQIQLGIKAGYNRSNIPFSGDQYFTDKDLSAFNAGLIASITLSDHCH
jgi:hypothetical protein